MLRERRRHANFKPNRKLDRKSSRGMLYENEELRLRTININAEVDRGQSDIRKLRRENEQLRREIWSLRDEYDRLDKLLGGSRIRDYGNLSSISRPDAEGDDNGCDSCDDSNSCDSSNEEDDFSDKEEADNHQNAQKSRENLHVNFDHLSIVSEENTPNCDDILSNTGNSHGNTPIPMPEFQSVVPPLAHFESIRYSQVGPSLDSAGEVQYSESTSTTGETVICVNDVKNGTSDTQRHSLSKGFNPFNFLKPTVKVQNRVGPADVCVSNVIATTRQHDDPKSKIEPIYAIVQKGTRSGQLSPGIFQRGGNLEDLLQDIEHLSSDIQHMQKQNQQYHSHLALNCLTTSGDRIPKPKSKLLQNKPFRSEMNLMLSFDGDTTKITPLVTVTNSASQDSPPPSVPNPMNLLPNTLPYIGFKEEFTRPVPDSIKPADPVESKENGFALIRRRLFTKKIEIPEDNGKVVSEKPPSGLNRKDSHSSSSDPNIDVTHQKPPKPMELRRKSRRISLHLNGAKCEESKTKLSHHSSKLNRRSNLADNHEDLPVLLNGTNGVNILGIMNSSLKSPKYNHRKLSQESVKLRKGRRHSDGGSLLGHDSVYEFGTSLSERYSNSLESSRESSTSLNIPVRKVSFGKSGGKIPWCACWGNGCF